jgi:iron complex outermembrane receptor protein
MKSFMALFLVIGATSISAQTSMAGDTFKQKNEVVVYGKGMPFAFNERTFTVQIFDIAQNRALPIRSVNEALAFVPGLDLQQRGIQGILGDLSIRGGTFEQNLVLINGFKLSLT